MDFRGLQKIFFILTALFLISCSESEFSASGCQDGACDEVARQSFSWEEGDWTQCSRACGGGIRTRAITCTDGDNVTVPDSECNGVKPMAEETCGTNACTGSYTWNIGPWSDCNQPCGGSKTRVVVCQDNNSGAFVSDNNCTETKPITSEECPNTCPPETYHWVPGEYNRPCACGVSEIIRTVTCRSTTTNVIQDDSFCMADLKPESTYVCPQTNCSTYSWVTGQYSTCSKTCGGGTQSRSLGCIRDTDSVYVPHTLCDQAQRPGTQQACNTQVCPPTCTTRTFTETVSEAQNQLDILLVVDDSGSMYQDSSRLATKLSGFVNRLQGSNINWQMCVTTTDVDYYQGRPLQWQGGNSAHILTRNSGNLNSIFVDTMRFIGAGFSSDEQAIKAMNLSVLDNNRSNCYRANAGLAVIVISDEDERSVGGNYSLSPNDYRPLGSLNTPQSFINTVQSNFPAGKRVTVNSIVVKDSTCQAQQNAQGEDARSFFGTQYMNLSNLTGGTSQSICMNDYNIALNHCYERIRDSLGTVTLTCSPSQAPTVTVNGSPYTSLTVSGNQLIFNPVIEGPATVSGQYCCQ